MKSNKDKKSELLKTWYRRARESQFSHYEAAKRFEAMNLWLGIPAAVLSALVGTSVFSTLGTSVDARMQIAVGFTSVAAALLMSLQTFLRYAERAEKHRGVASKYGSIRREIEESILSVENLSPDNISAIRQKLDQLSEDAPGVPDLIWKRSQKVISKESSELLDRLTEQPRAASRG